MSGSIGVFFVLHLRRAAVVSDHAGVERYWVSNALILQV